MPRTPDAINHAVRLGDPAMVTDEGPPIARTITIWYGVGHKAEDGTIAPHNYQPGDSRPRVQGDANGQSVSVTYDPLTTVDHTVQQRLIAAIEAVEGLDTSAGDVIDVS